MKDENLNLSSEVRKITNQLDEYEAECRHYKDEMKNLSRQLDSVEAENERLRVKDRVIFFRNTVYKLTKILNY